jgi:hypothetical protein
MSAFERPSTLSRPSEMRRSVSPSLTDHGENDVERDGEAKLYP